MVVFSFLIIFWDIIYISSMFDKLVMCECLSVMCDVICLSNNSWLPLTTVVHWSPAYYITWCHYHHQHQHYRQMTSRWQCVIMTLPCYLNQSVVECHRHRHRHQSVIRRHQLTVDCLCIAQRCPSLMTSWTWRQRTAIQASLTMSLLLSRCICLLFCLVVKW